MINFDKINYQKLIHKVTNQKVIKWSGIQVKIQTKIKKAGDRRQVVGMMMKIIQVLKQN